MQRVFLNNRWSRPLGTFAFSAALILLTSSFAQANPITFNFTGTVGGVGSGLGGTFSSGQVLNLVYTFESTTPARAGSNSSFAVFDALTSLSFTIGAYSASHSGAAEIQVDNAPGAPNDRYGVVARASDGLTGPGVNGFSLDAFGFRLDDSTNSVFANALTLPTSLSLQDFDSSGFFLFFRNAAGAIELVDGTVTSAAAPVPEPSSLVLMASGFAALAWATRNRRREMNNRSR
jgi:hypothetical protein